MTTPPFAVIPIGQNMVTVPTNLVSETSFMYSINNCESIVVTLIPGVSLPAGAACAVYAVNATLAAVAVSSGQTPDFQFLGGIGPGQESAMFEVEKFASLQGIVVGVDIEPEDVIATKLKALPAPQPKVQQVGHENTIALAQAIIGNAFDFIASFSGSAGPGGVEVVPLKAFENWWKKFEGRIRSDPSFLENKD